MILLTTLWRPLLALNGTWKIPVSSVREHATLTLVASTSSVALVMFAVVAVGASRSVTPPIMMLTTAKVPAEGRGQEVVMKRQ